MTNNDILKKLRVALKLRDTDIVKILQLVDFKVTESELSALFRSEDHPNYKPAGDQILRNFLEQGVVSKRIRCFVLVDRKHHGLNLKFRQVLHELQ